MSAGIAVTAYDLNNRSGIAAQNLKRSFDEAYYINQWLLGFTGDPDPLTQEPYNMTPEDVTTLRAAMADLSYMRDTAFNSSENVKKIIGLG